jgi:hypothetical protein
MSQGLNDYNVSAEQVMGVTNQADLIFSVKIDAVLRRIDINFDELIHYHEFVMAVVDWFQLLITTRLKRSIGPLTKTQLVASLLRLLSRCFNVKLLAARLLMVQ